MKNVILILGTLAFLSSCNSLEKMVDKGQYDSAVVNAAKKMYGSKHKKTKHVKVLEEAFRKANAQDLARAKHLESLGGANWKDALDIYEQIEYRQSRVLPFLPLRSKDGYVGEFKFVKTTGLITNATREVGRFYYAEGRRLLDRAQGGNKMTARDAYKHLSQVEKYTTEFANVQTYIDEAYTLGVTTIFVNLRNEAPVIMPEEFERAVLGISVVDLNDTWRRFHLQPRGLEVDVNATLVVQDIRISPEREFIREFEESKEIKDGWQYVLDKNGNVAKDSLGNDIKEDRFITVKAVITEVNREKLAELRGVMRYTDARTGEVIQVKPITVKNDFGDSTCHFRGDRRALKSGTRNRIGHRLDPFPTDYDMTLYAAEEMKIALKNDLRRYIR